MCILHLLMNAGIFYGKCILLCNKRIVHLVWANFHAHFLSSHSMFVFERLQLQSSSFHDCYKLLLSLLDFIGSFCLLHHFIWSCINTVHINTVYWNMHCPAFGVEREQWFYNAQKNICNFVKKRKQRTFPTSPSNIAFYSTNKRLPKVSQETRSLRRQA